MAKPINMPQVGQDLKTAIISEWCIKENDAVEKGDIIAVVESDKASFEVEAFESGTIIKLLFEEGDEAEVFKPIAYYGDPGETIDEAQSIESSIITESEPSNNGKETQTEKISKGILATPVVKRIAKEHNIDILAVTGSGSNGRILKEDILKYAQGDSIDSQGNTRESVGTKNGDQHIAFSKIRQKIASRLVESKQQIPHFYLFMDVDVTELLLWRQEKNKESKNDNKISVNDILIMSVAKTLRKFPQMNAHVSQTGLTIKSEINLGIAVSLEEGLIVPVLEHADGKEIEAISNESK
ncbi:MAG: 2-oxo acid dehydrogenase subunit E2, partial [Cyclobacteriaceae bacterium]|nr:2-oxo acid dehydrogenase subunit E2 [Cyclobacteriaceae bacterium]